MSNSTNKKYDLTNIKFTSGYLIFDEFIKKELKSINYGDVVNSRYLYDKFLKGSGHKGLSISIAFFEQLLRKFFKKVSNLFNIKIIRKNTQKKDCYNKTYYNNYYIGYYSYLEKYDKNSVSLEFKSYFIELPLNTFLKAENILNEWNLINPTNKIKNLAAFSRYFNYCCELYYNSFPIRKTIRTDGVSNVYIKIFNNNLKQNIVKSISSNKLFEDIPKKSEFIKEEEIKIIKESIVNNKDLLFNQKLRPETELFENNKYYSSETHHKYFQRYKLKN